MSDQSPPERRPSKPTPPGLRLLLELGPLVIFVFVNFTAHLIFGNPSSQNIYYATGVFMVAITASLIVSYWKYRKIPTMPLITGIFIMVFGTLTLVLHDETFIKVKPTLVNSLFAASLLGAAFTGRPLLKLLLDEAFNITDEGWMVLTKRWGFFFAALAILNEITWRLFSTGFWLNFKLFGIVPLIILFSMAQVPIFSKYAPAPDKSGTDRAE